MGRSCRQLHRLVHWRVDQTRADGSSAGSRRRRRCPRFRRLQLAVVERDDGAEPVDGNRLRADRGRRRTPGARVAELLLKEWLELRLGQRNLPSLLYSGLPMCLREERRHLARRHRRRLTWCSAIASSRADCASAWQRSILSWSNTLAKTPGVKLELADALVEHRKPGDVLVGWEIRCALDPEAVAPSIAAWSASGGADRLRGPGDVLEEDVAAGCERGDYGRSDGGRLAVQGTSRRSRAAAPPNLACGSSRARSARSARLPSLTFCSVTPDSGCSVPTTAVHLRVQDRQPPTP